MRKSLSFILIVLGVCIVLYPGISRTYYEYQQKKIIEDWQTRLAIIEETARAGGAVNQASDSGTTEGSSPETEQEKSKDDRESYIENNMEGMLKIAKINLYLPILSDVTEQNLNISIAGLNHTGKAGMVGNYSIAGHRSHIYGALFNRLNEVEVGDMIEVETENETYRYTVSDKLLVKPDEVWVLNNTKKKEITLITCDPMINPTHRLIIKGIIGP